MKSPNLLHKISMLAGTAITALVLSTGAMAQHGGGGGGGGHAGGGGGHAFSGGGGRAYGGGYHGGYGGYRGGYGYGGWHGGYGWRGGWGWGGWGWGWGLGLGLYFATLPLYYQTYWWGGVPYYYADNTYYIYDPNVRQYETVAPPAGLQAQTGGPTSGGSTELMVYPKNGQNADQQARDKFECHQWAVSQTGYDPTTGSAAPPARSNDYMRAQVACLEGRGYSVQ